MRIAIVCSAHGFGHLTRQLEVARRLRERGVTPILFTAAPRQVVDEWLPDPILVPWVADVGLVQSDSLTEDIPATRARLSERCSDAAVDRLAEALTQWQADLVVADTPPTALEAARRAGIPTIAVGNFTWPWIYSHYPRLQDWAERLAAWQAPHDAVSLWPGPGVPGFRSVTPFRLVGRRAEVVPQWPPGHVLVSFGGLGLDDLNARLPVIPGVTWVLAPPMARLDRPDCVFIEAQSYPAMVAAADVVVTKPGYGILAETARAGTKLVWVPRGKFPEARFITDVLTERGDRPVPLSPGASAKTWRVALAKTVQQRLSDPAPPPHTHDDSGRLADFLISRARTPARRP